MRYRIFERVDPRTGLGDFSQRYDQLDEAGQAAWDARILYLRDQPPAMWRDPYAKKLSWENDRDCKNLYEIRFKAQSVQQRPMGYFGTDVDQFTIVVWVTHKGSQYEPRQFCRIGRERWEQITSGCCATVEIEID